MRDSDTGILPAHMQRAQAMTRLMTASEAAAKSKKARAAWDTLDQFEREDESPVPQKPATPAQVRAGRGGQPNRGPASGLSTGMRLRRDAAPVKLRESEVLAGCKAILQRHPKIAMNWRCNTGSMPTPDGKRFLKFSFRGASDLMAVARGSGRFVAVECKATGKRATVEQQNFIDNVLDAGGFAICVDHPQKLADYLRAL